MHIYYLVVLEVRSAKWVLLDETQAVRGCIPSEAPGKNPFPSPFQLRQAPHISWLMVLSSLFKASNVIMFKSLSG